MKSSPSRTALSVEIKPSRIFYGALCAVVLVALAAIWFAAIPVLARAGLGLLALIYAGYCIRTECQQCGRLQWREGGLWQLNAGAERALELRAATLWPGLLVLSFKEAATRRNLTLTLWRDSLHADDARKLRVHLRHLPVFGE
ncbi:MAG: hypothetical protein JWM78_1182 [Verrucomicrobiaceae bacterium]|nr:hypothetical protein [Verrucomicrobiaceae bacterium]